MADDKRRERLASVATRALWRPEVTIGVLVIALLLQKVRLMRPAARDHILFAVVQHDGAIFALLLLLYAAGSAVESRLVGKSFISRFPGLLIYRVLIDIAKAIFEYRLSDQGATVLGEYLQNLPPLDPAKETMSGWRRALFNLYTWTMPLHAWLISHNVKTYYEQLKRSQWLTPKQIREMQELKLRELIHQAYYHVGYYREIFDRLGLTPADVWTIEDLRKLPLLDKKTVRSCLYFDLLSDNHDKRKMLKITTSGSTGEPFVTQTNINWRCAGRQHCEVWNGRDTGLEIARRDYGTRRSE